MSLAINKSTPGTPISEEDSDALHTLLKNTTVNIPVTSSQLTLEEVQQLLHEKGLDELATNLRVKLDKGLLQFVISS